MTDTATHPSIDSTIHALQYLAGVCDGAGSLDGQGFNRNDSDFGKSLAKQSLSKQLSKAQVLAGLKLVRKYQSQLAAVGVVLPEDYVVRAEIDARDGISVQDAVVISGKIDTNGENLLVSWPRSHPNHGERYNAIKLIQGSHWNGADAWVVAPMHVVEVLRTFPDFTVTDSAKSVVASVQRAEQEQEEADALERERQAMEVNALLSVLPPLDQPLPDGRTPRLHQQIGVRRLIEERRMILGDDVGLGKTMQALLAAIPFGVKIIVLARKSLHDNWKREASKMQDFGIRISVYSTASIPEPPHGEYVLVVDEAQDFRNWGIIAVDPKTGKEKIRGVQRTAKFLRLAASESCVACFLLTGTPMPNGRPSELFPLLTAIRHPLAANKRKYETYFCSAKATRFNPWDITGAAHLDELYAAIKDKFLRRKKRDCLDIPRLDIQDYPVEMTPEIAKTFATRFHALRKEYFERLEQGLIKEGGEALVLLGSLMQASAVCKIDAAASLVREILATDEQNQPIFGSDNDNQIVVFTFKREVARELAKMLGCEHIDGEVKDRQGVIDRFQESKHRVIVCTYQAAGVGLNMQKGNYVILVDPPWTPDGILQAHGRIERDGQEHDSLTAFHMKLPSLEIPGVAELVDIDERIYNLLDQKNDRIDLVLEGKRKTMRGIKDLGDIAAQLLEDIFEGGR